MLIEITIALQIREGKDRLLAKIDGFSCLDDKARKRGLLSFMQYYGHQFDTPSRAEITDIEQVPHDLIEENVLLSDLEI